MYVSSSSAPTLPTDGYSTEQVFGDNAAQPQEAGSGLFNEEQTFEAPRIFTEEEVFGKAAGATERDPRMFLSSDPFRTPEQDAELRASPILDPWN